ncbi:MAG: AAA family ATPase [Dysgonamonadaceae bacterium]|jgi:exonuclease SbcC|nr:AAA family ATPase [Dysgonamonadaceae bacterium]
MKILRLNFKNINSLAGESQIDFTLPQFAANGIFAITGKTGAGKTSILDAISLALFGKTPRVEITGQNNDVMTHGTSDCYAEIVFEVNGKKWKSSWKQERTRTGNLKPVNRQIADVDDKIIADHVRICDGKIVEILGLTFEQFTKVVMLAQGSFAAFLQADKNDKGELLEQITGTEIYGEISKKVFERNKTEKEKLDKILIELGAIKILSDEDTAALQNEIAELELQKTTIDSELQKIETAKKWIIDLNNLQNQIAEAQSKLPELQQKAESAQALCKQSEDDLQKIKDEKAETEKILVKVHELDTKIAEKTKLLDPVLKAINELTQQNAELYQAFEKQNNQLKKSQKALIEKQNWAAENKKYESLIGQYTAIENQNADVLTAQNDLYNKRKEFEAAQKELSDKVVDLQKSQSDFVEKETALNKKFQELETKKTEMVEILSPDGARHSLTPSIFTADLYSVAVGFNRRLSEAKETVTNFGIQIKNLIDVETSISGNQTEINNYTTAISACEQTEKQLLQTVSDNKTIAANLENQITMLNENINLTKIIQSLEDHRRTLKDGDPCPLCGALKHPYAVGNVPQSNGKETELKNLKLQFQTISTTIRENEKTLAKCISDKENFLYNKEKEEQALSVNKENQIAVLNQIQILQPDFSLADANLKETHAQTTQKCLQISALIAKATDCENIIGKIQNEEIPTLQKAKETAEKAKNAAETAQKLAGQQAQIKQTLAEDAEKIYTKKKAELQNRLNEYGTENIAALKKQLDNWNGNQSAINELTVQIGQLNTDLAATTSNMENNQKQMQDKIADKQNIETDKQKLSAERFEIFGDKQIATEEFRLKILYETAETTKTATETAKTDANTELIKTQAIITGKEKELTEKQAQKPTDRSLEELQVELNEKKPQSDGISQQIGAIRHSLAANDENLKTSGKKLKDKENQQQICNHWGGLNELIGSADGKKYRNFAQALTFEHLIGLANRQMQKMSDRYLLKRVGDAANPFELSVIDKFQNCGERTVQNLSGGEKFIASLSLALALANITGKNMKINSMFIDEGFGTLDSDYLDTALSALSNLQNEGKLIGVISHLTELKERIAAHIDVVPAGNGLSKIDMKIY